MPELYEKPVDLFPLACWVFEGEEGAVMCLDCECAECFGCPAAHRVKNGRIEYYRAPIHGGRYQ